MRIISLSGAYQCGKTTLAINLLSKLPNAHHVAFADGVKRAAVSRHPSKAKEIFALNKTPDTRKMLCDVSLDWKARFGEDFFTKLTLQNVPQDTQYLVISDTRFDNEIDYLSTLDNVTYFYIGSYVDHYSFSKLVTTNKMIWIPKYPSADEVANIILGA